MKGATEADAVPSQTKEAGATKDESAGVTTLIGIEDFVKVELRAAQVLTAERVPKADKLLKLTVAVESSCTIAVFSVVENPESTAFRENLSFRVPETVPVSWKA